MSPPLALAFRLAASSSFLELASLLFDDQLLTRQAHYTIRILLCTVTATTRTELARR
jgi:hypothetical protein